MKPIQLLLENRLFRKITGAFLGILLMLGLGYLVITLYVASRYFKEVNQQLYGNIASHMVSQTRPLKNGRPDTSATHDIIHSIMVINPSVEVYLLDTTGQIIDFVIPGKTVKMGKVNLAPVREFLRNEGKKYTLGDDPRNPAEKNVFSAAPIYEEGSLTGYAYAILSGSKQETVMSHLGNSFILKLGTLYFFVALFLGLMVGMVIFWIVTKDLQEITYVVRRFKEGDYSARIEGKSKGDLTLLSATFNEMAEAIVRNTEQLQSVERLRKELIANVSHDLRTPISIMQGYIETLIIKKEDISGAEHDKYLNIILDSSQKLSHLVAQLFEYTRLEANEVKPVKEAFFLDELLSDILMRFDILANKRKIGLNLISDKNLPLVFADIALVERVMQNLLDNAIKYTPDHGMIRVIIKNRTLGVEIRVSDDGIGISKEEQPYIFERYRQSKQIITNAGSKGVGLGLAIVKKILEIHQSCIHVQSNPDKGTSFWFQLPAYPGPAPNFNAV